MSGTLDYCGDPTIEVTALLLKGSLDLPWPRGASTSLFEVLKLWNDDKIWYIGKNVSKAVKHINKIIAPVPSSKKLNFMK